MQNLVWYVAYGSNMKRDRFMRYIKGGKAVGNSRHHSGFRDASPPRGDMTCEISHSLYFARNSPSWGGGGVAFVSSEANEAARVYCRKYLITRQQFLELVADENQVDRDDVEKELRDVEFLAPEMIKLKCGQWYDGILCLEPQGQHPVCTFTHSVDIATDSTRPSKEYLETVIRGLVETYFEIAKNYDQLTETYVDYLSGATRGSWQKPEIREIFGDTRIVVLPTLDRRHAGRSFIVQMHPSQIPQTGDLPTRYVVLQCRHREKSVRVRAKVDRSPSADVPRGVIRVDQKLRQALGVECERTAIEPDSQRIPGDVITVARATELEEYGSWFGKISRRFMQFAGAVQPQLMRVTIARYEDMEIVVCRIAASGFEVLGISPSDYVVIESITARIRLRALELPADMEKLAKGQMSTSNVRLGSCAEQLSLSRLSQPDSDLPLILLDLDARTELGVEPCDPVYVQRNIPRLFVKQMQYLSMTILVGGLILIFESPLDWWQRLLLFTGLMILAGAMNVFEIRKRIT